MTSSSLALPERTATGFRIDPERLGSAAFRRDHGLRYAYVAGSMYKGIASRELVLRMAEARLLGYLGTGGLTPRRVEDDIAWLQARLPDGAAWGMNLLAGAFDPRPEEALVELFLARGVRRVEAAAYTQVTAPLARYRLAGLSRGADGRPVAANKVLAKVSRPEVAEKFLAPAPERLVAELLASGRITAGQAELARQVPMADELCVEADSGGHTDQGVAFALLPAILLQRDAAAARLPGAGAVRVGAAGGIGAPGAVAAAFVLGADFVLTGSVNQCSVEAGISEAAKDLLQQAGVQDTAIAPAGDLFEQGAKVRVLRKGLLFAARAGKLYDLWRFHGSLEELDEKTRGQIENSYFKRSLEEVWAETRAHFAERDPAVLERAERDPKAKMALVFKWYFVHSARLARSGAAEQRVDYQIHCGPALGAFNEWVRGGPLEDWRARHVDEIAERLMQGAARLLEQRLATVAGPAGEQG